MDGNRFDPNMVVMKRNLVLFHFLKICHLRLTKNDLVRIEQNGKSMDRLLFSFKSHLAQTFHANICR